MGMASVNLALQEILKTLEAAAALKSFRSIDFFEPYPKQSEFFALGATKRERLLMAGNQLGKTYAGAYEAAVHLTGQYPKWWRGKRYEKPVTAWACGETSLLVRDGPQKLLFGKPGVADEFGTGLIPRDAIKDTSLARGVTDAYDTAQIKHVSGGTSTLTFKSYEQGRAKFQSTTLDFWWADEEPDMEIYSELLARITATRGMGYITFTPLLGMSTLVKRFKQESSPDRATVTMTIEDAKHIRPEDRQRIIDGYQAHERDARARGIPLLGSGRIFLMPEDAIKEDRIEHIPAYWTKLWGIDFGIGHPFAAVLILWDKDNDVIHVHHCIRMVDVGAMSLPIHHAAAMKPIGEAVPVAWPQDGTAREKSSGEELASLYKKEGLAMLPQHATWPEGGTSTEAGILEMDDRMRNGKLKIASHLADWFEEYRGYHRKDGQIVKVDDDLMSATRIAIMMKRFARIVPLGSGKRKRPTSLIAEGVDFDPF